MFQFYAGNRSVIESKYGWPFVPRGALDGEDWFYSGPQSAASAEYQTVWNLTITHTGPTFFSCGAPGCCFNYGMRGVNLTGQVELAKEARYVLYPGETLPPAAATSLSALAATVLADPTTTPTQTSQPTQNPQPAESSQVAANNDNHLGRLSTGAIAGIAVGGVAVLAILGALAFYFGRSKGQIKALKESHDHAPPEMTVDGITYVRAGVSRAMSPKPSFLPPYASPESRSKSPDSSVYGPAAGPNNTNFSPRSAQFDGQSPNRFSGASPGAKFGFYAPTPRHEMPVARTPALPENGMVDVERFGELRSQDRTIS